jgi:hypothetical protein
MIFIFPSFALFYHTAHKAFFHPGLAPQSCLAEQSWWKAGEIRIKNLPK